MFLNIPSAPLESGHKNIFLHLRPLDVFRGHHLIQNWFSDNVDMFWPKDFWPPNSLEPSRLLRVGRSWAGYRQVQTPQRDLPSDRHRGGVCDYGPGPVENSILRPRSRQWLRTATLSERTQERSLKLNIKAFLCIFNIGSNKWLSPIKKYKKAHKQHTFAVI